jgi:hypothetical protein
MKNEIIGGWIILHNEELYNLYSSPNTIIRVIKLRKRRRTGHVAHVRRVGIHKGVWWESQKE